MNANNTETKKKKKNHSRRELATFKSVLHEIGKKKRFVRDLENYRNETKMTTTTATTTKQPLPWKLKLNKMC